MYVRHENLNGFSVYWGVIFAHRKSSGKHMSLLCIRLSSVTRKTEVMADSEAPTSILT